MNLKEYIEKAILEINVSCLESNRALPTKIEFNIQVDERGDVCKEGAISVGTIRIEL